ncbi:MAG: FAD-binding oxidoreductase [Phycisphaeraceae bacterium]|nr:FAD-binding oxidoreductase [Phycisphaeraceae bacterium]
MRNLDDSGLDRRRFLRIAAAGLAAGTLGGAGGCAARGGSGAIAAESREVPQPGPHVFAAPDLSDGMVMATRAGIRPYRSGRVRVECEPRGSTLLLHNYGHGGAGVTLSFGCAAEILRLVRERAGEARSIAVLGAGVIGLTTAYELLAAGFRVRVYTRETLDRTTSWLAGAQWAPSLVARGNPPGDPAFFGRVLRDSHARFNLLAARGDWGVVRRPNFVCGDGGGGLRHIPSELGGTPEIVARLPIAGLAVPGEVVHTMLIEPPVFLPRLTSEVLALGGEILPRSFESIDHVLALRERVVVNCLGLGTRALVDDPRLVGMRGQVVLLRPQNLPYMLSHGDGHMFPRHDAVVLGGTVERGVEDPTPNAAACGRILAAHRRFFAGA